MAFFFVLVPAFAGRLTISSVWNIGSLQIHWYGLVMALAILICYFVARKKAWKFGIEVSAFDDFVFWLIIVGILGARLYYVLFSFSYFSRNPSEIYKIWHGGLSIYGAVLAGLIFCYFYTRKKAYSFLQLTDLLALVLPLGQAIGRIGNFINQEAFGLPTNLPWKMYVAPQYRPIEYSSYNYFHPTFLYEMIVDLIVFFVLMRLSKKNQRGLVTYSYLFLYSLGRFFIEGIRLDSFFIAGFRVDQVLALILLIISGFLMLRQRSIV